ncbi:putative disease resistance protein At3g14460 [Morus notabilis]|uniref:putative disease resistance protein At3g14460 n=1 Tax=Morus notabilis TaxID=981085 RepID=UPI000CED22E8|nr:putative disease resistance protein At3g14460 [Morus notabilis]
MVDLFAGALLSAIVQVLIERLACREVVDYLFGKSLVVKRLEELKVVLLSANKLLDDAEEKQLSDRNVGKWLGLLADVALEADDLVDEINYKALSNELESRHRTSKFLRLFSNSFMNGFGPEIEEVIRRLRLLIDQRDVLGLQESVQRRFLQRPIVHLVEESDVYERDFDKTFIVELLVSSDCGGRRISAIPIVGMGGIGKTTLAQLVYNDDRVDSYFDVKVWVTVSDEFDVSRVTRTILETVSSRKCAIDDLYQLLVDLREALREKRFLFVLDDVWNENYHLWDALKSAFESGAHESKIIVTTRSIIVARMVATGHIHYLSGMSEEGCWKLFSRHAFSTSIEVDAYPALREIGREIVKKCNGLPLAVKSLGGLLRPERNLSIWESILRSNVWELYEKKSEILPALWLSYRYLPSHLKRCFAYCAIFPKDYAFQKEKIILLWMAEGLLQPKKGKRMEEIGEEYFQDLISRSLFQRLSPDKSTLFMHDLVYDLATVVSNEFCFDFHYAACFIMHDLVNDLAKYVAGDFCFRLEGNNSQEIPKSARHFSYMRSDYETSKKFDSLDGAKCLRTFLPLNLSSSENFLSEKVTTDLLPSLTRLRVLSLSHYSNLTELPDSVSNLKHLRYLDLSHTGIKMLPASISTLYYLQTLKLSNCFSLTQLPSDIGRLINLRHLYNDGTNLKEMPLQICHLKDLQTLTMFVLGKGSGASIRELGQLQNLRGTLSVLGLQNIVCAKDALDISFKDKKHLKELVLEWDANAVVDDTQKERELLDKMQPHTNLKRLTIKNYGGTIFPHWLGNPSFSNIVFLSLMGCENSLSLPPLGQLPSLKELSVIGFDLVEKVGHEFCGDSSVQPFRCLEILRFADMLRWKEWRCFQRGPNCGSFPSLRELYIENCKELTGDFPDHLPELAELGIIDCPQLMVSLCKAPALCQLDLVNFREKILETIPPELSLSWLSIAENHTIVSLPDKIVYNNTLEELNISNCLSLSCLLKGDDPPPTLKVLGISGCLRLEFPMYGFNEFIESLSICFSCSSLKSFPLHFFPKLNRLHIEGCEYLESLSFPEEHFQALRSLRFVQISECHNFLSFPRGGLPAPNLTWLVVEKCEKLKSLPQGMYSCLSSLQVLRLSYCQELSSFPKGGLPSSLRSLSILSCEKLIAADEWNLQGLSLLRDFSIGVNSECEQLKSFPQVGMLPPTLTSLYISGVPNLKSLNHEGLQHLKSLKELKIHNCPELQFMPEGQLPSSLRSIQICNCHLLKEKWQGKNKNDWNKIAQDACLQIDDDVIFTS